MFNAKKVHDKKSPLNEGQRNVTTSIFIGKKSVGVRGAVIKNVRRPPIG